MLRKNQTNATELSELEAGGLFNRGGTGVTTVVASQKSYTLAASVTLRSSALFGRRGGVADYL